MSTKVPVDGGYGEKFDQLIQQASEERTFSLASIEQIKELRDKYAESVQLISQLQEVAKSDSKTIEEQNRNNSKLTKESYEMKDKLEEWEARERSINDRERKQELIEAKLEMQGQRVQDHKEMMAVVFKNVTTQRTVLESSSEGGTYNNMGQYTPPTTTSKTLRTEETANDDTRPKVY